MEARVGDGRTVILHVDLDCFYAAVEHVRLGIPMDKPLAVQQWEGLIAVNYPARAAGVVRHDRVKEALKKCPELQLVHVETVGSDEGDGGVPNRSSSKVSLERYRQASLQVFSIFRRFASVCERASIDEAYLDVTSEVDEMLKQKINLTHELERLTYSAGNGKPVMVVENGPCNMDDPLEERLVAGAVIGSNIREATKEELGYSCSVGIAPNKLLAKIASARNKPDRQTLVPPKAVSSLMDNLPLKKIKLLGGKVGEELQSRWSCKSAGEAQAIPLQALVSCFGERMGVYAWRAVRGAQNDKVQVKQIPKSMLAAKSFSATTDSAEIRRWFGILAEELSVRLLRDLRLNQRQPKIFQLYYRYGHGDSTDHSKSCSMPHAVLQLLSSIKCPPPELQSAEHLACMEDDTEERKPEPSFDWPPQETTKSLAKVIQEASFHLFQQLDHKLPYTRLAISASGFQNLHVPGTQSIQRFFSTTANLPSATPSTVSKTENLTKSLTSADSAGDQPHSSTAPGSPTEQEITKGTSNEPDETEAGQQGIKKFFPRSTSPESFATAEPSRRQAETTGNMSQQTEETEVDLKAIDVAEQRRILRSIEHSSSGEKAMKRRKQADSGVRSISSFFNKR